METKLLTRRRLPNAVAPGGGNHHPPHKGGDYHRSAASSDLSKLSTAEIKRQLDELSLALADRQQPDKQDRDLITFSDCVHASIDKLLAGNIAGNVGPLAIRSLFKERTVWGPVSAFLERSGFGGLAGAEKTAVYRFLADLVVRHAYQVSRRSKAPMSPKLVANCSGNLGGLFEREFPGYLRNGLAKMVARRICAGFTDS